MMFLLQLQITIVQWSLFHNEYTLTSFSASSEELPKSLLRLIIPLYNLYNVQCIQCSFTQYVSLISIGAIFGGTATFGVPLEK